MQFHRSSDARIRSDPYRKGDGEFFCLAEVTASGVLITEFSSRGLVEKQVYSKTDDPVTGIRRNIPEVEGVEIADSGEYMGISVDSRCSACGGTVIRELDLLHPSKIVSAPVVPFFVCRGCGRKFYSMTDSYLKGLVYSHSELFEKKDLEEREADEGKFLDTLQEYIIRIFASKKITRIK